MAARSLAMPIEATHIVPPSRRYMTGSLSTPWRAKNSASMLLCPIINPGGRKERCADGQAHDTALAWSEPE